MRKLILVLMLFASPTAFSATPEQTLEQYFQILTSQNTRGIEDLMDRESMAKLKQIMDDSIRYQANFGVYRLQRRIFGKKVPMAKVEAASAEFYLQSLANEIVDAAKKQNLRVKNRTVIGNVQENDSIVHAVVRLELHQLDEQTSDIQVYTLVNEDGDWKLKFPPTIKQMLSVIESSAKKIR